MKTNQEPVWKDYKKPVKFPKLETDAKTDVVVIGGGLAGLLTAYFLAQQEKQVVLIESEEIGAGASGYTTAMISHIVDTSIAQLVKMFGRGRASLVWQAGLDAIDNLQRIIEKEHIDCDFKRCSAFTYAIDEDQAEELKEEFQQAKELGYAGRYHEKMQTGFENKAVWIMPNQAKFHPLKFLYQLSQAAEKLGVKIYEHTEAKDIIDRDGQIEVKTAKSKIMADSSVMATYKPFKNPIQTLFKKGYYRTYELAVRLPKNKIKEGLYWDLSTPYYFFRIDPQVDHDLMILGGADHRAEMKFDEQKGFKMLEEYLQKIMPGTKYQIKRQWSGLILEPSDGLALIGEYRPNQYVATAFSGNGMTYSTVSGKLISDLILGQPNPYAKVFDPKRIPSILQLFEKAKDYLSVLKGGAGHLIFKKQAKT